MFNSTNARMEHINTLKIPDEKEYIYLDFNTRLANDPRSSVVGNNNKFESRISLDLDESKHYSAEIISLSYTNQLPKAGRVASLPVILCNVTAPIIVDGYTASVFFRSHVLEGSTSVVISDTQNNINFKRNIKYNKINSIEFEIVSSTDGTPFFTDPDPTVSNINIIMLITNK